MRKYLLILLNVFVLNGQNLKKLDDYSNKFFEVKNNKEKLFYANAFMDVAKKENKKKYFTLGYYLFVNFYRETNPQKALYYFDKVIENSKYQNLQTFPMVAYCEKAELLHKINRVTESMKTYNEGLAYCREIKNDYEDVIELSVAITKSEELGETEEALKIYKKCYKSLKQDQKFSYYYLKSIFSIADAFKTLKFSDSATYYNRLGYKESVRFKNKEYEALFVLNEGANLINKKKFKTALDSINKIKSSIYGLLDQTLNPLACHFYSGKAYLGMGEYQKALIEFKKVDSFYQVKKRITPEFVEGYTFLINYFHKKGDVKNELKYLKIFNIIEENFAKKYKNLYKNIKEKYEIPQLIRDKENENFFLKSSVYIICSMMFFAIIYIVYIKLKIVRNKKLFEEILKQTISTKNSLSVESDKMIEEEAVVTKVFEKKNSLKSNEISTKVVDMILQKLLEFEKNKDFLKNSITSQSLANEFNTNSKYVSKIINDYKNCKVNEYVNSLRIEYAILILQKERKMRKYNLEALSIEFGFNNVESFNTAFLKKTGLKASYFIKELEKKEKLNN